MLPSLGEEVFDGSILVLDSFQVKLVILAPLQIGLDGPLNGSQDGLVVLV